MDNLYPEQRRGNDPSHLEISPAHVMPDIEITAHDDTPDSTDPKATQESTGADFEITATEYEPTPASVAVRATVEDPRPAAHDTAAAQAPPNETVMPSFEPYRAQMNDIDAQLAEGEDPAAIPGYIDSGATCHVYETADGKVLKMPRVFQDDPPLHSQNVTRGAYITPLQRGMGGTGLEQIVTATEENGGAIVCERAPGDKLYDLTAEQMDAIPQEHYAALLDTCKEMSARQIQHDFSPANLFYSEEAGFTVIDYRARSGPADRPPQDPAQIARDVATNPVMFFDRGDSAELHASAETFYAAYAAAFGEKDTALLRQQWVAQDLRLPDYMTQPEQAEHSDNAGWDEMTDHINETLLEKFEPYQAQMNDIDAQLAEGVAPRGIAGYVASGGTCHIFDTPDGNILKMPRVKFEDEGEEDGPEPLPPDTARADYIIPLQRGVDVEGLEQIVAATEENGGAIVCERAPGKLLEDMWYIEIELIPPEHYRQLMETCKELATRNLIPDYAPDNIFYSEDKGFTIIDYSTQARRKIPQRDASQIARSFGTSYTLFRRATRRLPELSGRRFFDAYREAFGDGEIEPLLRIWRDQELKFPEDEY
jgi:RIO-like serine/threonine protein kinase